MITPGYLDLVVYQGATFDQTIAVEVDGVTYDLTGDTATLPARRPDDAAAPILLTETTGLTLGNGTIAVAMTATATAAITAARYPYVLEVTGEGSTVTRILEGTIRVVPEVTAS
jgi:hypothetical protein